MTEGTRRRLGVAGALAAGTAIAVGELLAGLVRAIPSPLAAIGGVVIDASPSFVKDFAIAVFGTADKTALAIGTTLIALLIGWRLGRAVHTRRWLGPVVLGVFGILGLAASLGEPFAEPAPVVAAALVAVAAGTIVLEGLVRMAVRVEEPTDSQTDDASRRTFIRLVVGGSAAAIVAGMAGRRMLSRIPEPATGDTIDFGTIIDVAGVHALDVAGLTPIVVPNSDFYRIDTALVVPLIDERDWSLRIHGDVAQEVELSYDDLLAMRRVEEYVTIACVSNEVGGGLVGNALWSGPLLTDVLDLAGVDRDGTQLVGRSIDGFTVGFPTEVAYDGRDPLLALGMNGEPLPRKHGYPARLIVPGLYGYVSATKWLTEIEITGWDEFDAYWIPRGWAKEAPIKTQSRIDVPRRGQKVDAGPVVAAGVAWAPVTGIERVEVRVDRGQWREAERSEPLSDQAWIQWSAVLDLAPGEREIQVRATDGTGEAQDEAVRPPRPDGATGFHTVVVEVAEI